MEIPPIRLNGTGYQTLFNDAEVAVESLSKAIRAVLALAPHPRDYFKAEEYQEASRKHFEVHRKLYDISVEINDYLIGLYSSNPNKA